MSAGRQTGGVGGGGEKGLKKTTETGPVLSASGARQHRGDHAVVLLPGAAAAEEGDEEDDDPDPDDDDGDAGGRGVVDLVGVVQGDLDHDAQDDQGQAAQLQGGRGGERSEVRGVHRNLLSSRCCRDSAALPTDEHYYGLSNTERLQTMHLNTLTDENHTLN